MDYTNLSIAELRGMDTGTMDEAEFGEWLKANQKARGIATDAKKAQRETLRTATEASVKPTDASIKDLDLSWNTENKVTYKVTVQTVNGKNKIVDFNMSGNHASPTTSVYAGYTFTIDGQSDIHFTTDSSLNWGEFNLTDIVKLSSAKRVVSYFGVAVRGSEFKEDGVTKSNEATSTPYLATKLTPEQIERVALVGGADTNGESIALADFLASLS